jgi:hypothetical protein
LVREGTLVLSEHERSKFLLTGFMRPPIGINPNDDLLDKDGNLTELGSLVLSKAGA